MSWTKNLKPLGGLLTLLILVTGLVLPFFNPTPV